jgi:cbb3-type cytochrome oxidase maturation protein
VSISYLLVLLGLGILGSAVWALFWAIDTGQYDNLESEGRKILDDETPPDP